MGFVRFFLTAMFSTAIAFALFLGTAFAYGAISLGVGWSETLTEGAGKGLLLSGTIAWLWFVDGEIQAWRDRQ